MKQEFPSRKWKKSTLCNFIRLEKFWWALWNDFFLRECVLAVQSHPRSFILVAIESAYATSY